jgi:hypothetical protein
MGSELFGTTNIVLQLSDNETVKNATNALTKKHPDNSYIAKIDDNSKLTVYDNTATYQIS